MINQSNDYIYDFESNECFFNYFDLDSNFLKFDEDFLFNNIIKAKEEEIFNNEKQDIGEIEEKKLKEMDIKIPISKLKTNYDSKNRQKIFHIIKKSKKTLLGRKKKSKGYSNFHLTHNKYSKDNMTRKLKSKLFASIIFILNNSLKEDKKKDNHKKARKYNYSKYFLLKVNKEITTDIGVIKNRQLLSSKLKDIFSSDVNQKYKKFGLDYNKKFIEKIYSENTKTKTIAILEKTLIESLEHFRGSKYYEELNGLEKEYENIIKEMEDNEEEEEYIDKFKNFVNIFEEYYQNKKARKEI